MIGQRFAQYIPNDNQKSNFEKLSKIFFQLLNYTAGDASEALEWMTDLDKEHHFTDQNYGMADLIEELKAKGYIQENSTNGTFSITSKSEQTIRKSALEEIFGKLKQSKKGNHQTPFTGGNEDTSTDSHPFEFGDSLDAINMSQSIQNAQVRGGIESFDLVSDDLEIQQKEKTAQNATVLMIDISHSMILYGEDRITPAKKVAMALAELIHTKYPKDTLDIIVFGNDAWPITIKDLPYLQVGPYHTNTYAGLQLAMDILRRKKTPNKQIFMITDGKPTCLKEGSKYYKNSFGLDRKVINKTLNMAAQCRRLNIPITTFMIAKDPYLMEFVKEFTETNKGRAFYSSLNGLGEYIFEDYIKNRRKTTK
jgi:uncharacterized protein with von Willebrand factor type A (vWA) domain